MAVFGTPYVAALKTRCGLSDFSSEGAANEVGCVGSSRDSFAGACPVAPWQAAQALIGLRDGAPGGCRDEAENENQSQHRHRIPATQAVVTPAEPWQAVAFTCP